MKHALRSLIKSPGFTLVALVTLALGVGANTAMVSLLNSLLFRAAPYPDSEEIVQIVGTSPQNGTDGITAPQLLEMQAGAGWYRHFSGFLWRGNSLTEPNQPAEQLLTIGVVGDFFQTLGVQPLLGRTFTAEELHSSQPRTVVLSYPFWQRKFNGRPDIVGRTIHLDGELNTVVGVMPASFDYRVFWGQIDLWRPYVIPEEHRTNHQNRMFSAIARLQPGQHAADVHGPLDALAARYARDFPQTNTGRGLRAVTLREATINDTGRRLLWLLVGLSGFVLLIGCANLANLQLARATAQTRDLAIRAALGASRRQLILHQLTESLLLALAGGALGVLVALWGNDLLERSINIGGGPGLRISLDPDVLVTALLVSLVTGIVFGLVPAWFTSRADVTTALKQQSRNSTASRSQQRLRQALIVGEIALALVLLGGASVMLRGFDQFLKRNPGWKTAGLVTASVTLPDEVYTTLEKRRAFQRTLGQRLRAQPGVEQATLASTLPLFSYTSRNVAIEGQTEGAALQPTAQHAMVTSDYFATLGVRLLAGRLFPEEVKPDSPDVVIINEAMARHFWPGQSAVGKRIGGGTQAKPIWHEIIGVVSDVEFVANTAAPDTPFQVYRPFMLEPWNYLEIAVRGSSQETLKAAVRQAVREADPNVPAQNIYTIPEFLMVVQRNTQLIGRFLGLFALLGLGLAAVGLYGVISNLVAQRTAEFGIRLAFGARTGDILRLVLGNGARLAAVGTLVGLAGAYAITRLLASLMPRLADLDLTALGTVTLLLFAVALFACWVPARRATKVDPLIALRSE